MQQLAKELPAGPAQREEKPDIILILNETFYDLDRYTELDADRSCLANWYARQDTLRGYAVATKGTNYSEYELLTSNTTALTPGTSPFNILDLNDSNSIVRYLKAMGYTSVGMHAASPVNYNRNRAYPALGFDRVLLGADAGEVEYYGERPQTDAANYDTLIAEYEAAGPAPRFLYLLTYQNHGGWDQNDAALDTVHTGRDLGRLTEQVNEFLTSISMSDEALEQLLSYFETVDRPVLVCMVGDHEPVTLVGSLPPRSTLSTAGTAIAAKSTPFMIWANPAFGTLQGQEMGVRAMTDLVPLLVRQAGLPLSVYYQTILDLGEQVPIRFPDGRYYLDGEQGGTFTPGDPLYDTLAPYYYMACNNLKSSGKRVQALFDPPDGE